MAGLRSRLLAAIVAGGLCGAASALTLNGSLATGAAAASSPPGLPVSASVAQAVDPGPVVAFGDSLTYGFGVTTQESYPTVLQRLLGQTVVRMGFPGKGSATGVEELPQVLSLHPRLVVLEFGSVDACLGVPMATAAANLETILGDLDAHGIPAVIVGTHLGPERIPKPPTCVAWIPYLQAWDTDLEGLAAKHGSGLVLDILRGLGAQPDGYHPDAAGYATMAQRMLGAVRATEALGLLPL